MKNVKMTLEASDYRPAIVADDVEHLAMDRVQPNDVFNHE